MALESMHNGYRGEHITGNQRTPRYRLSEFELCRKVNRILQYLIQLVWLRKPLCRT